MNAESVNRDIVERRWFVRSAVSAAGLVVLSGCAGARAGTAEPAHPREQSSAGGKGEGEGEEAEVTPGEDLMQEHGLLERILLVYAESIRRIEHAEPLDLGIVTSAADIVRRFVEEYHERQEEDFVFPRLEAAGREVKLVAVLRRQHQRGREVTAEVLRLSRAGTGSPELAQQLRSFERMYRPHAAREDTVLFPAFRDVVGNSAYRELGEQFEDREHEKFGDKGFENTVGEVAKLETALGIEDLDKFTP
jgi:hemerythrin-like domain-containing protein